jgi:STAS-like domain of unknown function (DUF4325)
MEHLLLADHGAFLGSRFTGKELREHVEAALARDTRVGIDFAGVESVTDSFLDELLAMLVVRRGPRALEGLVLLHCSPEIAEAVRFSVEEALSQGAHVVFG